MKKRSILCFIAICFLVVFSSCLPSASHFLIKNEREVYNRIFQTKISNVEIKYAGYYYNYHNPYKIFINIDIDNKGNDLILLDTSKLKLKSRHYNLEIIYIQSTYKKRSTNQNEDNPLIIIKPMEKCRIQIYVKAKDSEIREKNIHPEEILQLSFKEIKIGNQIVEVKNIEFVPEYAVKE